ITSYTIAFNHTYIDTLQVVKLPDQEETLENLFSFLVDQIGGSYKISSNHIMLLSEQEIKATYQQRIPEVLAEPVTIEGVVKDSVTFQPLVYATICLLDEEDKILKVGVTDDEGTFSIESIHQPVSLRISYIGYSTLQVVPEVSEPAVYILSPDSRLIEDVIVTAGEVTYQIDRNSYQVTAKMREGTSTAVELLNKIHDVRFNPVTQEIKVGTETAVLLLIDGLQQSQEYIRSISPDRIQQIEIVHAPTGRYLSEGYSAIINFKLKKDYTGYDLNLTNFLIMNAGGNNGDDWVMMEQPSLNFSYTKDKWNIYGFGGWGRSRWNTMVSKEVEYKDLLSFITDDSAGSEPNNLYKYQGGAFSAGTNYRLKPDHVLSAEVGYEYNTNSTEDIFAFRTYAPGKNSYEKINNQTLNDLKEKNYVGTFYYKGKFTETFELYSDLSYNYYSTDIHNHFSQQGATKYQQQNEYRGNKNQLIFNLEGTWTFSPKLSFNSGYMGAWRNYLSKNTEGKTFLDYDEIRNKLFAYVSFTPDEKLQVKAGTGVEYLYTDNNQSHAGRWNWQPYLQMNYKINPWINMNAGYITDIRYPSLYQLSSLNTAIDSILTQRGNPDLKSALRHTVTMRVTFWDRVIISPVFKYTPERISDYYRQENGEFYRTFENINMKQYILRTALEQPIGRSLNFSANLYIYKDIASLGTLKHADTGFLMDTELDYYNQKIHLGATVNYTRMLERSMMLQGYQMINSDGWYVNVVKQFPKQNLTIRLSWVPPLDVGVRRDQEKWVNTGFYKESTIHRQDVYKNMILLNVGLRFRKGQVKTNNKQSQIEREEREKQLIGF
ncbi:MAG: TonB-dependent receptor, partial [Tannerellaceae bacterium]|nr:TonB-dependent receptor [Tannerellaceae bacterium]